MNSPPLPPPAKNPGTVALVKTISGNINDLSTVFEYEVIFTGVDKPGK
jgi:hypothetical protein